MKQFASSLYFLLSVATAMVGLTIHGSAFWAVLDALFVPLAWAKWLICHEVSVSVLRRTFEFLLQ